ncbi:rhodanese-like domain-containing protein [Gammaproteobacteria bacterium]|nr:rhodanese-like domain-containing protein [Gammaproteobacteria bacterium]
MPLEFIANNWYLFVALVVVLGLLLLEPIRQHASGLRKVSPLEMPQVTRDASVIVDVSEPAEYKKGHIPNAVNVTLKTMQSGLGKLEKQKKKTMVVVCRSGNKAPAAARFLLKSGFENTYVLTGGMMAWQKENLPVVKG